ncbi:YcfL family protein [Vibrio salinus]|uniref:YcfL family protein n=1 Tax=Vibrio salinus TaxID=2899784 RepID=UPI001E346F68|nr:YcfL family protein [Vibrio salinus]MCE0492867.1 YcfL family protein [Vibrio salinus]
MMKKILFVLFFSSIAIMGCSSSKTSGLSVDSEYQRVLFGDSSMSSYIRVDDISTQEVSGHTRGVVRLENLDDHSQALEYRFYWYDENGLEVSMKPGAWKRVLIGGKEMESLSEVSISPKGKNFRLQVRASK